MNAVANILAQSFGGSKNYPTFATSSPKIILTFVAAAIFYARHTAKAVTTGYQIPANCCTAKSVIVFGETGGDSLSYIHTASFHSQMPKTMKSLKADARGASASTANARKRVVLQSNRKAHDTSTLYSQLLIEKNAKNKAYLFVLSSGLLKKFTEFSRTYQNEGNNVYDRINALISNN